MAKSIMNLQDSFLNQVRKDGAEIMLIMLDGTQLSGSVRGFDNFTVIVHSEGVQHLIYKHAISQIITRRPVSTHGEGDRSRRNAGRNAPRNAGGEKNHQGRRENKFNAIDLTNVQVEETKDA